MGKTGFGVEAHGVGRDAWKAGGRDSTGRTSACVHDEPRHRTWEAGLGKLRYEMYGKLRASQEGCLPGREPASHLAAGSPLLSVPGVLLWKPWCQVDCIYAGFLQVSARGCCLPGPFPRRLGSKVGGRGGEPSV